MQGRIMLATSMALIGMTSISEAARPTPGARYVGETSQGFRVTFKVTKRGLAVEELDTRIALRCPRLGRLVEEGGAFHLGITRAGRFGEVDVSGTETFETVIVDGSRRRLFQVDRTELRGQFVSRTTATGAVRVQRVYYDKDTMFEREGPAVDRCDTGPLTWMARRR